MLKFSSYLVFQKWAHSDRPRVTKSVLKVNFTRYSPYQRANQWETVRSDIYWTNTNLFPPKINNIHIFSKPCKVCYRSRCRKHVSSDLILSIVNRLDCWIVVVSKLLISCEWQVDGGEGLLRRGGGSFYYDSLAYNTTECTVSSSQTETPWSRTNCQQIGHFRINDEYDINSYNRAAVEHRVKWVCAEPQVSKCIEF